MKVIILAAGEGTRLRPYTIDRPKCLVNINKRCLLDWQLDVLKSEDCNPIILVGGYKANQLQREGTKLLLNPLYAETNMVWTLFCAEPEFEGGFLLSYGDIVYSRNILHSILESKSDIAVAIDLSWESYWRMRNEDPLIDAETLKLSTDGRILEIGQKPQSLQEIEGQYIGLIKLTKKGVSMMSEVYHDALKTKIILGKQIKKAYLTDLLQLMINLGIRVEAVPFHDNWIEIDTVQDLKGNYNIQRLYEISKDL